MPTTLAKWLTEKPVPSHAARDDLHKRSLCPLPVIDFVTQNAPLSSEKSQVFFLLHEDAMNKISAGARIFDSIDNDVASLRLCMQ